jgi:hypothetical protein
VNAKLPLDDGREESECEDNRRRKGDQPLLSQQCPSEDSQDGQLQPKSNPQLDTVCQVVKP